MAIEEKNALELIDSYTVTPGDTEAILSGMDDEKTVYLLIFNNVADSDDGASLSIRHAYNENVDEQNGMNFAGRQNVNGTNTNQSGTGQVPVLVNYGTTGSQYETNGHAWIYRRNAIGKGIRKVDCFIGKAVTYNDTDLVSHDIYGEISNVAFTMNGIKLYPNSGAWDSGEFKLYKLRRDS